MYNRYLRNEQGDYTRIPVPDPAPPRGSAPPPPPPHAEAPPPSGDTGKKMLSRLLEKLKLQDIDTSDLLLLLILFFLFEEKADDELLIALGLLLIL